MKFFIIILALTLFVVLKSTEDGAVADTSKVIILENSSSSQPKTASKNKNNAGAKSDSWSSPPNFLSPDISLWTLKDAEICDSNNLCRPIPSDKMYCTSKLAYEEAIEIGKDFVSRAKSDCKKWGADGFVLARKKKIAQQSPVISPPGVREAVKVITDFYLNQTHVSWILSGKVIPNPYEEIICISSKDREAFFNFYAVINRRCMLWNLQ